MSAINRIFAVLLVVAVMATSATAQTYNAGANMLANVGSNPNGVWRYGWAPTTTGPFTLFTNPDLQGPGNVLQGWNLNNGGCCGSLPHVIVNTGAPLAYPDGVIGTGEIAIHPDGSAGGGFANEEKGVVRFTAPTTNSYSVNAFFEDVNACCGTNNNPSPGVDVHIVRNAVSIFDDSISRESGGIDPLNLPTSTSFSGVVFLNAGDTLDFVVGTNGQLYGDETRFNAVIATLPEPTSVFAWVVVGLGVCACGWRRARRRRK